MILKNETAKILDFDCLQKLHPLKICMYRVIFELCRSTIHQISQNFSNQIFAANGISNSLTNGFNIKLPNLHF